MSGHVANSTRMGTTYFTMGMWVEVTCGEYFLFVYIIKAKNNGLENSVCTLYEIHSGEDSENEGKIFFFFLMFKY